MNQHDQTISELRAEVESLRRQLASGTTSLEAAAFEHCTYGIAVGDPATDCIMACNPAFARLHGRTVGELIGQPILSLYAPSDHDRIRECCAEADRTGQVRIEVLMQRKDGATFPLRLNVVSVRDMAGTLAYRVATTQDIADQWRIKEQFTENRELLEAVVSGTTDAIYVKDREGRYLLFNEAAEKISGKRAEEVLGRDDTCLFPPDQARHVMNEDLSVVTSGTTVSFEETLLTSSGEHKCFLTTKGSFRDEQGTIKGIFGISRDITERKQIEKVLEEERNILEGIMRATDVMIAYLDPEFNFVLVNPSYATSSRMTPEEIIGRNHFELYPDEENESIFRRVRETGEPVFFKDKPFRYPDQPERGVTYWDWSLTPVRIPDGTVSGLVLSLRETTDYMKAINSLQESEERFHKIFDNAATGIAMSDMNGLFIDCNPAYTNLTGYAKEELAGMELPLLIHPGDREHNLRFIRRLVNGEIPSFEIENRYLHKSGNEIWVRKHVSLLYDHSGNPSNIIALVTEITERKLMEEKLCRLNEELEQRIAERTAELVMANDQLQQRERLLRIYLERMPIGHIVWDPDFRVVAWNPASERIFGFTAAEAAGKKPLEFFVSAYISENATGLMKRIGASDLGAHSINENLTKDGRTIICEWHNTPLFDRQGTVTGALSMVQDITERKKMEEELRKSEERYRALVETTNDWIWEVDEQGRYTYASPKVRSLLGYAPDEVLGHTPFDFMPEDEARRVGDIFAAIIAERRPFPSLENVNLHKDGRKVVLETSGVPAFDATGEFRGYRGIDRDITERKQEREILLARLRLLEYSFTHPVDELLRATLDEAEQLTGSLVGFYHFLEEDQRTLSLQAWSARTTRDFCTAKGSGSHYDIDRAGVWVDCVHERRAIIHNDYTALPHRKGLPDGHSPLIREMVVPVFRGDRIVAILGVGNKPADYTGHDIEVVSLLADLAWEIAELKIVENKLRSSEERLALAQRTAGSGLWDWDMKNGQLTWSKELFELFGLDPDGSTASFDTWRRVVHPDDIQAASGRIDQAIKDGAILHNEYRVILPNGDIRWINALGRTLYDKEMRPARMTGICIDITERIRMDQALRASETLFRTLCDDAPIGIFKTDQNLTTVYRNPSCYAIFGFDGSGNLDVNLREATYHEDRKVVDASWSEATSRRLPFACEFRVVTTQQNTAWVKVLASPIWNPDGTFTGYVGTIEDITEVRQVREELLKAQKLESLGLLAGGIAHDFNNLLTAIVGNISLAEFQRNNPETVTELLREAEGAAAHARNLTQQLLTFARGGEPVKKVITLSDLIRGTVGFAIRGTAVACKFSLPDDLWPVEADEGQLRQVIHNLAINGVQAMPDGGTLTIGALNAFSLTEAKRYVEISVSDTGIGIPANHLPKIFDPYYTTKQHGSGLGLATCHSIVTRHGGTIRVESSPGEGSSFTIRLPAAEQAVTPEKGPRNGVARGTGSVLVMDDERPVRKIAQAMLQSLGYMVECTAGGDEAIERYRERLEEGSPFDAIIMDLTVPGGKGGKEAVKEILRLDPCAKVIASSGYSTESELADYREHGFCAILGKPYRLQELVEVLESVMAVPPHFSGTT